MLKNAPFFQFFLSIFCISFSANQSGAYVDRNVSGINPPLIQPEIETHFTTIWKQVENRWQAFQKNKVFISFEPGKPDAILEKEFENIQAIRSSIWSAPGYELAQHLIANDLVRAPGCVAFAYNNTVASYNASTICINNQCHIACEGPRAKDITRFFDLLTTYP